MFSLQRWMPLVERRAQGLHGFRFENAAPGALHAHWESLSGEICPLCDGWKSFVATDDMKPYYCFCATLQWLDRKYHLAKSYGSPAAKVNIDSLNPLNYIVPTVDTKAAAEDLNTLKTDLKKWIKKPDYWMLIVGGTGCGKSHIMQWINSCLPWMSTYISAGKLQGKLFTSLKDNSTQEFIEALSRIPLLLLDDWGLEHAGSFTTDALAAVIDARYLMTPKLPVIVTTNRSFGDLTGAPDQATRRIASRMVDTEISQIYRLRQEDYRSPVTRKKLRGSK